MPSCDNCGGDEFECVDGLFYCQVCQTQSQDLREEEGDIEGPQSVRLAIRDKTKKGKRETVEEDHGRPWQTHEAFTIILKQQVKALIELGADPQLEEMMFKLWTLYLSKSGVAFDTSQCSTSFRLKGRDLYPGTLTDPKVKPVRRRQTCLKRGLTHHHPQPGDKLPVDDTEVYYEGDNPYDAPEETSSLPEIHQDESLEGMAYTTQLRQVNYMSMQKTICFCYLGLCHTSNLVLPMDLLRWIKSGLIPYGKRATELLPGDMKFGANDASTFCSQYLPSVDKICNVTGSLAHFLGIKFFPKMPLEQVGSRFILELNLPGELHGLVRNLMRRHPIETQRAITTNLHQCAPNALLAMSYLIVLLKLILGLDDHTEKELSSYARELIEIMPLAQPLFIWDDWREYTEKQTANRSCQGLPCNSREVKSIRRVDQCLKVHQDLSDHKGRRKIVKAKHSSTRRDTVSESLREPFDQLLRRLKSQTTTHSKPADRDESPIDADPLQAMHDEDLSHGEESGESEDFTVHSLRYITEDTNFVDQPDSLGLSESTICSSCVESDSDDSDRCDSEIDSFQPRPKRRKAHRGVISRDSKQKGKNVVKAALRDVASPKITKKPTLTPTQRAQIRQLMNRKVCAFESYTFYKDSDTSDKTSKHRSYTWLLGVCSRHIDTDVACLDKYVRRLEMAFIIDEDELCTRAKWQKRAFQRRYLC